MPELTKQQIANRAYYAANAERIKAEKREKYHGKPKKARLKVRKPSLANYKKQQPAPDKPRVKKQSAMSRIEDIINERKARSLEF